MPQLSPLPRIDVPDAVRSGRGLSPWMRDATRAFAETLFTTDDGAPSAERLDWLCDDLDDFLARSGGRARGVYGLCVTAVGWLAPLHLRRLGAFHHLAPELRTRALERMERGPFGLAIFGAKAILCILWYEHPEGARHAGYDGKCLTEAR